jgi:hypothetical protein
MKLLTPENTRFDMNMITDAVDDDVRYCILDYSDVSYVDFIFIPLIFTETYNRPSCDLKIGNYRIQMPLDWSIVIADKNFGNLEIIELKHLNDRPFDAFIMNPINGYMPEFGEISMENIFPDVCWNAPKLKYGHILAVPLNNSPSPPCAFFIKDINKITDVLDITKIF